MWTRVMDYLVAGTCGAIAFLVRDQVQAANWLRPWNFVVPVLVATAVYGLLEWARSVPLSIKWIRKHYRPLAVYEGHWIETQNREGHRHFSVFSLEYDALEDQHQIAGCSAVGGDTHGTWTSTTLEYNKQAKVLRYLSNAELSSRVGEDLLNVTSINFKHRQGFFVDCTAGTAVPIAITLSELKPQTVEQYLGPGTNKLTDDNRTEFVRKYSAAPPP